MSFSEHVLSPRRRRFLRSASKATVSAAAVRLGLPSLVGSKIAQSAEVGPMKGTQRVNQAYQVRHKAALYQKGLPVPEHLTNGDEELYSNGIASYTKGLPHDSLGNVDLSAYSSLLHALSTGSSADFESVPMGGVVRQANPQAALAFEMEGADSHHLGLPAAPAFSSAEVAGEMVELYWQAVTRDIPFSEYESHPLTQAAARDLSQLSDFRGPRAAGQVTPGTLFRGNTAGDLTGPYISQFLWKDVPYGATTIVQRYRTTLAGDDRMSQYFEWLDIQNGLAPGTTRFDSVSRYIRNGRDLGEYVHRDFTYQAFLNACLILLGMRAPLDQANPYDHSRVQSGFATFGAPHILDMVTRVANCGLKAAWFQKWLLHRRLRPEEFGGRVHNHKTGAAHYPIHRDVLNSTVLDLVFNRQGTYLLPMGYAEGAPTHPAYPAGHAVIAGACTTVLKGFFDESFVVPDPKVSSPDGLSLVNYAGPALTLGGELDKLASNIALGRDTAGVHWRSDGLEGLRLGEAVAISVLTDFKNCLTEDFEGFSLTKFDGTRIQV